jgi:hypothetical protein
MGEWKEYPNGVTVRITGGIYKRQAYTGTVTGKTKCMVYVHVPALGREVRVWRTSVERARPDAEGQTAAEQPARKHRSVAEVVAQDEQLQKSLADVCRRLTKHGYNAGDPDIHDVVDAGMREQRK